MRNPYIDAAGLCTAAANDDEPPVRFPLGLALLLALAVWLAGGAFLLAVLAS